MECTQAAVKIMQVAPTITREKIKIDQINFVVVPSLGRPQKSFGLQIFSRIAGGIGLSSVVAPKKFFKDF